MILTYFIHKKDAVLKVKKNTTKNTKY